MQGRILTFFVKDTMLRLVSEKEVKGAVYNANSFQVAGLRLASIPTLHVATTSIRALILIGPSYFTGESLAGFSASIMPRKNPVSNPLCAGEAHSRREQQGAALQVDTDG